jgi:hypothetical protein
MTALAPPTTAPTPSRIPAWQEMRARAETGRRVPDESIRELIERVAVLGRGCGSTAWVYGVMQRAFRDQHALGLPLSSAAY